MDGISAINSVGFNNADIKIAQSTESGNSADAFGKVLSDALKQVNDLQTQAEQAGIDLAAGKSTDIHNVMIATEKANLAMGLTVQVRNKVVEAYQEMMRMQI